MNLFTSTLRPALATFTVERLARDLSRFTLFLMVVFLLCMPLMEKVLTFDHFAETHHDFEFETLFFLTVVAVYLLLASLPKAVLGLGFEHLGVVPFPLASRSAVGTNDPNALATALLPAVIPLRI
jgi:hypothetical protein